LTKSIDYDIVLLELNILDFREKKMAYEKLPHKYQVGEEVTLPGTRIRSPHYVNQFMYNKTGIIKKRGWSKEAVSVKDKKIFKDDGISFHWLKKLVHIPIYVVNGRWYREGKRNYGVCKLEK
jgi:hypothetical protein